MTNLELVRIVEEQGRSPVGIPVLLFTDQTLAVAGRAEQDTVVDAGGAMTWGTTWRRWSCSPPSPTWCRRSRAADGRAVTAATDGDLRWTPARRSALSNRPLLALNFHEVPPDWRGEARRRLRQLAAMAPPLELDRLDEPVDGPRIVIGWYDGWRDTALFGAEACADLGLRAFFFPITRPQASRPRHPDPG